MKSVIVFVGSYKCHIPFILGFFGKENLEYKSEFNPIIFDESKTQLYYHTKLNCDILIYRDTFYFLEESNEIFDEYDVKIFSMDLIDGKEFLFDEKISKIPNSKKIFIWYFGEVFTKQFLKSFEKIKYDKILLGSNRPELECEIDYLLPFRYFRYYIGYYWIEDLMDNFIYTKYNKNSPRLFSYSRAYNSSSWRNEYILKLGENLTPKNSANDAYDLTYPKYKHFETIFDYTNCNINLIFETINCGNTAEAFLTEKTYKGLFFAKPFYLLAPVNIISYLKSKGFYLLNFEFGNGFDSITDLNHNFNNFKNWVELATEEEFEKMYNIWLEKSQNNRKMLFDYLNDFSESEKIIKKLLN
jgi:hypothetical protein